MSNKICIYHAYCTDGFAAALAVYLSKDWGPETKFVPASYGDAPPDVKAQDVIIVDFSYSRETLEQMHHDAKSLLVLDHHKTAEDALDGLTYAKFDMNKSGAVMTWEELFPENAVPNLIYYVQDRDLWQWELEQSREVSAALACYSHDFEMWLQELLPLEGIQRLKTEGQAILKYQNQQVRRAVDQWEENPRFITLDGHRVPVANCTSLISEICGELSEGHAFACTYFDTNDKRVYSLRMRQEGESDVSQVARVYGGGGHPKAAGFTLPLDDAI